MMTYWYIFYNDMLLLTQQNDGSYAIPVAEEPPLKVPVGSTIHQLGMEGECTARTYRLYSPVSGHEAPQRIMVSLRDSYDYLPLEHYNWAGKAFEILNWDKNSQYCPACGVPTKHINAIAKKCPQCRQEFYPPIVPAIIVRIERGDSILMVKGKNFRGNFYGLVAGFVEAGETLEECVAREVREETGLTIKNIRYFGSQPWPYPSGIMIGFTAEYVSGDVNIQQEELNDARFFTRDNMPQLPRKLSIARKLVDDWLAKK